MSGLVETIDERGVATLTLDRVERRNALDQVMISQLTETLRRLEASADIRVLLIAANGPTFCAGGAIDRMDVMGGGDTEENAADALALAQFMRLLDTFSKPTVALAQGPAYGGGVGLIACCDIAIAADHACFCLSEVKLGIIPGVVGPYVLRAIGARQSRRFVLTGEEIAALDAMRIGLVHEVVSGNELAFAGERMVQKLLVGGPSAQKESKALLALYRERAIDDALMTEGAQRLARRRASPEGREGLRAFLEKRRPAWPASF